jgi:hypothetical protein
MKKILILFAITAMLVSCKEDDPAVLWDIVNLEVRSADWTLDTDDDGTNGYYYCEIDMPEITPYVFNDGMVQAYFIDDGIQQVLPYTRHYEVYEGENLFRWTRTIDYDYSVGSMTIYVTNSDFVNERPSTMDFRVVLMW